MTASESTPTKGQECNDSQVEVPDGLKIHPWVTDDSVMIEMEIPGGEATLSLSRGEALAIAGAIHQSVDYLQEIEEEEIEKSESG